MSRPLLPQQPAPVTRDQARLTAKLLTPAIPDLMALFQELRRGTDAELPGRLPPIPGKAYPLARCQEITVDVLARLKPRLAAPQAKGDRALRAFLMAGGLVRPIWGALRETYFQNAVQMGALYVDVANDTVNPAKPQIEILPMDACGLVPIRDAAHFAKIAAIYWGAEVYANHLVPSLAPILPLVSRMPGQRPRLQSASDYMIDLFRGDRFAGAEAWLADGPPPPADLADAMRAVCPAELFAPDDGRAAALAVCRTARAEGRAGDVGWRDARVADYLRIHG